MHVFLRICTMRSNVSKVRMTQLTAYLFVAIPVSLGGKYISVHCMKDRHHLVSKPYFGAERST